MKILFVCTGNICRSPMGEYLLRNKLIKEGIKDIEIISAGTTDFCVGSSASADAIQVMDKIGIDLKPHIAQQVSKKLVEESDYIIAMTQYHKDLINMMFYVASNKVYMLSEFDSNEDTIYDIPDPYGHDLQSYYKCRDMIKKVVEQEVFKFVVVEHELILGG